MKDFIFLDKPTITKITNRTQKLQRERDREIRDNGAQQLRQLFSRHLFPPLIYGGTG